LRLVPRIDSGHFRRLGSCVGNACLLLFGDAEKHRQTAIYLNEYRLVDTTQF
jgi:hypothetical protein